MSSSPCTGDTDSIQSPPASPGSPLHSRPDRSLRSQSQPAMWQAGPLSQGEVLQVLQQHAPSAPPQSLNKYKVLPSIERRQSEASPGRSLDKKMSKLSLFDDGDERHRREEPHPPTEKAHTSRSEVDKRADDLRVRPKPPDPGPATTKARSATASLLLAVRAPCGSRFQQHFDPADTLLTVRASAEVRYGAKYAGASIETVDLPRRTFTDLDMTLAQCGILNRSVLCISQSTDAVMENE